MITRLLVLYKRQKKVHKWLKLCTKIKRLIKSKAKGNYICKTDPTCTPKINCLQRNAIG